MNQPQQQQQFGPSSAYNPYNATPYGMDAPRPYPQPSFTNQPPRMMPENDPNTANAFAACN